MQNQGRTLPHTAGDKSDTPKVGPLYSSSWLSPIMPSNDSEKLKILFVCSRNKWRSPTAEKLWDGFQNYAARSAGTEKGARVKVTAGHVGWADLIVVMEKKHKRRLQSQFGHALDSKKLVCLNIADDYAFMDAELISLLKSALSEHIAIPD